LSLLAVAYFLDVDVALLRLLRGRGQQPGNIQRLPARALEHHASPAIAASAVISAPISGILGIAAASICGNFLARCQA